MKHTYKKLFLSILLFVPNMKAAVLTKKMVDVITVALVLGSEIVICSTVKNKNLRYLCLFAGVLSFIDTKKYLDKYLDRYIEDAELKKAAVKEDNKIEKELLI